MIDLISQYGFYDALEFNCTLFCSLLKVIYISVHTNYIIRTQLFTSGYDPFMKVSGEFNFLLNLSLTTYYQRNGTREKLQTFNMELNKYEQDQDIIKEVNCL